MSKGQAHPLVFVARHGNTKLNSIDSFRGPLDVDLDKTGWRQANALKEYLKDECFSYIFCSDKKRTVDTANKIAEAHPDLTVQKHHGLRAFDVGFLGGQPKNEENQKLIEHYVKNPDVPIPDGESLNEFKSRVRPLIKNAVELAINSGKPVLIVAHSSIIHEVGDMIGGHHQYTLVEPGGVACIFVQDGELDAAPVYRKREEAKQPRSEIIT
jgi:broad specificity phosphatase PhoE